MCRAERMKAIAGPASVSGQRLWTMGASSPAARRCITRLRASPGSPGKSSLRTSSFRTWYATSGRAAAISSSVQMSTRASSTNRPLFARHDRLVSMKPSPVRLFSTTSTPAPLVASRISSPNAVVRLSNTCSTPSDRRYACLRALAVAKTSAPAACAHWMAASPTPPAPA